MKKEFEDFPGFSESRAISRHAIETAVGLMEKHFEPKSHEFFSWGSVARREMGPYSDLDFVLASNKPDLARIARYRQELAMSLSTHYLDILEKHTPQELLRIAKIDGTDRQALLFMRNEQSQGQSVMTDKIAEIKSDDASNLREIFHILANLEFVYPRLFGSENLKFGPGRMKDFHFAFLLSRFTKNNNSVQDLPSALLDLNDQGYVTSELVSRNLEALDVLMYLRNRTQEINGTYHTALN